MSHLSKVMSAVSPPWRYLAANLICWLMFATPVGAQQDYESFFFRYGVFSNSMLLGVQPTRQEFGDEVRRADIVLRGRIQKILRRVDGSYGDIDAVVQVDKLYKGELEYAQPCVRIEAYNGGVNFVPGLGRLPEVGAELILPIFVAHPYVGAPPPNRQAIHYVAPFYYTLDTQGRAETLWRLPPEWKEDATAAGMERIIAEAVRVPAKRPLFKQGEVLFYDDFDDGSVAGWTFLEGAQSQRLKAPLAGDSLTRSMVYRFGAESWAGPAFVLDTFRDGLPVGKKVPFDQQAGMYRLPCADKTLIEFGVVNGRMRLRGASLYRQHLTAVAGDPQWTDYQIDVDMWTFTDPTRPRPNYLKFGPYGRVQVPNSPTTRGEHSFVAAEVGTYGNYDVAEGLSVAGQALQLRCKYPEPSFVSRERSRLLRLTKVLDWEPWPVKDGRKLHLTARFFGRYVEVIVDGRRILESWIPRDHPGAERGRVALWTFETWAEFDNFTVTRLLPEK